MNERRARDHIVFSKNCKNTCQELFDVFYKKIPPPKFITAIRPEGAECGEWLRFIFSAMSSAVCALPVVKS